MLDNAPISLRHPTPRSIGTACVGLAKDGTDDQRADTTGAVSERRAVLGSSLLEDRTGLMDKPGGIIEAEICIAGFLAAGCFHWRPNCLKLREKLRNPGVMPTLG